MLVDGNVDICPGSQNLSAMVLLKIILDKEKV